MQGEREKGGGKWGWEIPWERLAQPGLRHLLGKFGQESFPCSFCTMECSRGQQGCSSQDNSSWKC